MTAAATKEQDLLVAVPSCTRRKSVELNDHDAAGAALPNLFERLLEARPAGVRAGAVKVFERLSQFDAV